MSALLLLLFLSAPAHAGWNLVWSDDFRQNGRPDAAKWKYETGGDGGGNDELQYYTDRAENARVENGHLVIESRLEEYGGRRYTSARLNSRASWKYGRFVVRARLPAGRGTWPAIWMMPTFPLHNGGAWPDNGEIDIMEHVGYDYGVVHGSLHMKAYNWMNNNQKTAVVKVPDVDGRFHDYGLEWTENEIVFLVDDVAYYRYANPRHDWDEWPFDSRFHLILNLAIGGNWGGKEGVDDTAFPQSLSIESVKVYQLSPPFAR